MYPTSNRRGRKRTAGSTFRRTRATAQKHISETYIWTHTYGNIHMETYIIHHTYGYIHMETYIIHHTYRYIHMETYIIHMDIYVLHMLNMYVLHMLQICASWMSYIHVFYMLCRTLPHNRNMHI